MVLNYQSVAFSDVFFQSAWDALKQKFIEEESKKLGVEENDTESSLPPHIDVSVSYTVCVFGSLPLILYAQISSPVDPALLSFKLNKLQQAQNSHHADVQIGRAHV